jgi:hypothetical protein
MISASSLPLSRAVVAAFLSCLIKEVLGLRIRLQGSRRSVLLSCNRPPGTSKEKCEAHVGAQIHHLLIAHRKQQQCHASPVDGQLCRPG